MRSWVSWVEAGRFRRGHRLRHLRPPYVRRHEAVRVQNHGFRQDLDGPARRAKRRARLRARHQGRHRRCQPAVSRNRIRPVDQHRRRPALGAVQGQQFPAGGGAGSGGPSAHFGPGPGNPRARHLDHRRHLAAARADSRIDVRRRRFPADAPGSAVDGDLRRVAGGRRLIHRAQPHHRGLHPLLPAIAPHLRRLEDRDLRCAGQARGYGGQQQTPGRQPRHLVDAPETAAASRRRPLRCSTPPPGRGSFPAHTR